MKFEEKVKLCSSHPHGLILYIRMFLKYTHLIRTSHTIVFTYLPNTEGLAAGWDLGEGSRISEMDMRRSMCWWSYHFGEFEDEPKISIDE